MPNNINSTTFVGLDGVWVSFLDPAGIMSGFANISTNAAASGLRRMKGAETLPTGLLPPNRKVIKGDDRPFDQFIMPSDQLPGGDIIVGTNDLALDAAGQSSTVWALGNWSLGLYGISTPTFPGMMTLAHQQAHSQDAGSQGQPGFNNILYPNTQLLPLGEQSPAYQQEGKNVYGATFSPFSTFPTGSPLDNTNFSVVDGIKVKWFSTYRTFFHAKWGDASWTSIVLDFTPVNAASTKVFVTTGGTTTLATITSVTPSTKTVLLSAAPAAGAKVVVMYEASKLT